MNVPRIVRAVVILALLITTSAGLTLGSLTQPVAALGQGEGEPVPGGMLRLTLGEEPDQLDPALTFPSPPAMLWTSSTSGWFTSTRKACHSRGWPSPGRSVKTERPSPSKSARGVKFHDGTDLDANAVKLTYDRILDPEMAAPYKSLVETLVSVDVPDATTAVFNFSEPYAPFFTNSTIIGIISPAAVEQFGDDFGHNPVGTGPFMFKEWQPGTKIVFERYPDYVNYHGDDTNKGPAYVDGIEYFIIGEAATRTAAFENQEIDLTNVEFVDVARFSETPGLAIISLEAGEQLQLRRVFQSPAV